jgi:Protein of unknown function (DUF3048) N-terminal domain/Protein of unknown function (DUF3048) C-terminal domain
MPADQSPSGSGPDEAGGLSGTAQGPPVLSRQDLRRQAKANRSGWERARWYVLSGVAVLAVGSLAVVLLDQGKKGAAAKVPATTSTAVPAPVPVCPLTGAPAPGGAVPARPALAVKIGNFSGDRPSTGLNQADIVFEEPVEGAITRLVAVFQCRGTSLVGDLRSARQPDAGILSQFSNPLFAHAGGISPVLSLLASSPLIDKNVLDGSASTIIHPAGRFSPYSTFADTATLWALDPADTSPPAPVFQYSTSLPAGAVPGSGASVHIPFSSSSDVTWLWSPSAKSYLRSYSGTPDRLLDGGQTAATNVVIMTVQTTIGSWVENEEGGHEVVVTGTGSGPLLVMRNGAAIAGTWSRSSLTQPAALTGPGGVPITLQPGNTWVELVPDGIPVTPVAVPTPALGSSTTSG